MTPRNVSVTCGAIAVASIDHGARNKNADIITDGKKQFGPESGRYVVNHAKIGKSQKGLPLTRLCRRPFNSDSVSTPLTRRVH